MSQESYYAVFVNDRRLGKPFTDLDMAKAAGIAELGEDNAVRIEALGSVPAPVMHWRYDRDIKSWVTGHS